MKSPLGCWGLRFRVEGSGLFRVQGLGFRVISALQGANFPLGKSSVGRIFVYPRA